MDIQYNGGNNYQSSQYGNARSSSALVNLLIDKGVVKTEGQANAILIIFIVLGFGFTIYTVVHQL